jgi:hypothetical protein
MNREARKVRKRRELKTIRQSQKHDNGIVRFGFEARADAAALIVFNGMPNIHSLRAALKHPRYARGEAAFWRKCLMWNIRVLEAETFKVEHDLTAEDFQSDHWQTLFRIQYPEGQP